MLFIFSRYITNREREFGAHFLTREARVKKPRFPLQVLAAVRNFKRGFKKTRAFGFVAPNAFVQKQKHSGGCGLSAAIACAPRG
jgi:hypothetical protein